MKKGFTLIELLIVIIVLGVLASIAMPNYFRAVENGRKAEGVNLLGVLRGAQLRYYAQNSAYTADLTVLDVDYTAPAYYTMAVTSAATALATATRNSTRNPGYGSYVLTIQDNGTLSCSGGTGGACARLGY